MNTTGWLKGLQVTGDGAGIVSHAGVALVRALADNIGLTAGLSRALASRSRLGSRHSAPTSVERRSPRFPGRRRPRSAYSTTFERGPRPRAPRRSSRWIGARTSTCDGRSCGWARRYRSLRIACPRRRSTNGCRWCSTGTAAAEGRSCSSQIQSGPTSISFSIRPHRSTDGTCRTRC